MSRMVTKRMASMGLMSLVFAGLYDEPRKRRGKREQAPLHAYCPSGPEQAAKVADHRRQREQGRQGKRELQRHKKQK